MFSIGQDSSAVLQLHPMQALKPEAFGFPFLSFPDWNA